MIAAIFDVDHTLVRGSSGGEFLRYLWKMRKLRLRNVLFLTVGVRRYRRGKIGDRQLVELGARSCFGLRECDLVELGRQCAVELASKEVYQEARDAISWHRSEGHHVMLASGSPCFIVQPLAEQVGVDDGIGAAPVIRDGICTKEVVHPIPFGEGKLNLVVERLRGTGLDLSRSWFYSDREIDLPLLEAVGHPVAVNPKPVLLAHAREKDWQVVLWTRNGL